MKRFQACKELTGIIKELDEEIKLMQDYVKNPAKANFGEVSHKNHSSDDVMKTMAKIEQYVSVRLSFDKSRNEKWNLLNIAMRNVGVSEIDIRMMKLRYFYGLSWNEVARMITAETGKKFDVQKLFRHQRKIKKKLT